MGCGACLPSPLHITIVDVTTSAALNTSHVLGIGALHSQYFWVIGAIYST